MGARTRTTLDSARAKELAANRPAASQRRDVDYAALARRRWDLARGTKIREAYLKAKGGQNGTHS